MIGKKDYNNYDAVKRDFFGEFGNHYMVDKTEYENKKLEYLARDRTKEDKDIKFNLCLKVLCNHLSLRQAEKELRDMGLTISFKTIQNRINKPI